MPKPGKQPKPRKDRGGRYCMVLELEETDRKLLDALTERYAIVVGATAASKAFVIRQLLRDANVKKSLPPVRA